VDDVQAPDGARSPAANTPEVPHDIMRHRTDSDGISGSSSEIIGVQISPIDPGGSFSTQEHFRELDGMRGVLAVTVMLFHFGLSTLFQRVSLGALPASNWGLCVDFFFLLSGFVLCRSYERRRVSFLEFAWRRALRLFPLYWTGMFAALICVQQKFDASVVASNLVMAQGLLGAPSINFPAWSVPFEFYLPLMAIAAVSVLGPMPRRVALALFACAVAGGSVLCLLFETGSDHEFLRAAAGLSGGALLYGLWMRRKIARKSASVAAFGIAGALVIMMLSGLAPSLSLLFYPCAIAAIWFGAEARGIFSLAGAQAIGRWSYSIYLLHIPVLAGYESITGQTLQGAAVTKALLATVVIVIAGFSYRHIEVPAINFARRHPMLFVRAP